MKDAYYLIIIGMGVTFLLALCLIAFYILYQRKTLRQQLQLQKAEFKHQEELLHATIQSQEDERRRIGRDLHDGVGSLLSNLRMNINRINTTTSDTLHLISGQCSMLIDKTIADVRSIAHSLSPPGLELFGLDGALEELCDGINRAGEVQVNIHNSSARIKILAPNTALALFRVLQELLSNTLKHAEATVVQINISDEGPALIIHYKDNGKGFMLVPGKQTGMGMRNIESRLGMIGVSYALDSSPGNGFAATITVPLNP